MEQQSPTPRRPDDVTPDAAAPPPVPTDAVKADGASPAASPGADASGSPDAEAPPAPPLTPMGWLQQNSPFLLAVVAGVAVLYYYGDFDWIFRGALVVAGIGLLIFIHELGHFLAAKWCNVHVQTFSLGFGPALPGCSFKWGETTYKIGVIPLGGYVQMVGEGAEADEDEKYPRSFKNKTVLQRMFIISAGVVMNVVLAFVCFAIVYQFHGMETLPAAVAATDAGSPAWKQGIPGGSVFTKIGSTANPNFPDLQDNVTLTWWEAPVPIEYRTRDGQTHQSTIVPRRDANDVQPVIGVSQPSKLVLRSQKYLPDGYDGPAERNTAAAAARAVNLGPGDVVLQASDPGQEGDPLTDLKHDAGKGTFDAAELCRRMRGLGGRDLVLKVVRAGAPAGAPPEEVRVPAKGFQFDDVITGTTNPDHPDDPFRVTTLKTKPGGTPGKDYDYYDYQERMKLLAGKPAVVEVLRESKGPGEAVTSSTVKVLVPPAFHRVLGLRMKMGEVAAVRDQSPASDKVREGDRIIAAKVIEGDRTLGDGTNIDKETLDPVRLPYELEKRADLASDRSKVKVQVVLTVSRFDPDSHGDKEADVTLNWDDRWRFDQELPFGPASPMAIPELGIAYHVESTVVDVRSGGPAAKAGLQPNDRIQEICYKEADKNGPGKWGYWGKMAARRVKDGATVEAYDEWPHYFVGLQNSDTPDVKVRVWRNGAELPNDFEMTAEADESWPLAERGEILMPDLRLQKADNVFQAIGMGMGQTWSFIRKMYQGLVSMGAGRIDPTKNVQGPINIFRQMFEAAQDPFALTLMIGVISINLAVVNFLPIPVLDGGHMVFLVYELVRRKPPSDAVRAIASYVGLAVVAMLMLFVVYLDISHWIWGGGR